MDIVTYAGAGPSTVPERAAQGPGTNPALAYLLSLPSPRSRRTMASYLRRVASRAGAKGIEDCRWTEMRRPHIQAVLDWLQREGRAPNTVNTYLAALKGVALEAWTLGLIETDAYLHIKHVRSVRGSRLPKGRALEQGEIEALLKTCSGDGRGIAAARDEAIITLMLGCGPRRSEVVGLDVGNIDWREGSVRVLGKGNKERLVFLPERTERSLHRWVRVVRGDHPGPLFTRIRRHGDNTGERLSDQAIYHILQVRGREAGLEEFSPHDLRRTFATRLLDNGEDLVTVKELMGHASVTTTQDYDRRGRQRLKEASRRLRL